MNNKKLQDNISPALVVGFGLAAVLSISFMQMFFLFLVPAAGYLASKLTFRLHPEKSDRPFLSSMRTGLATGFYAAFFMTVIETTLTLLFKTNNFIAMMPEAMKIIRELGLPEANQSIGLLNGLIDDIKEDGFSAVYSIIYFLSNTVSNALFCLAGSILFAFMFKRDNQNS